jgi:hypothetical protein
MEAAARKKAAQHRAHGRAIRIRRRLRCVRHLERELRISDANRVAWLEQARRAAENLLFVDERAIAAAQVYNAEVCAFRLNFGVMRRGSEIVQDKHIIGGAAKCHFRRA